MRISYSYKFVFLAVPRTGSTTVRRVLDFYSDVKSVNSVDVSEETPYYHHISAAEVKAELEKRGQVWQDFSVFCVTRNPYDRVVSLYHHWLSRQSGVKQRGKLYNSLRRLKNAFKKTDFEYFVQGLPHSSNKLTQPLKHYIFDNQGHDLSTRVLRFEDFSDDLLPYLRSLTLPIKDGDIPHLNSSEGRRDYQSYYSEKSRDIVSSVYRYEIERFEYEF